MMVAAAKDMMTLAEAAAQCDVDYDTFLRWVRAGRVPFVEVGPHRLKRVRRGDVEQLVRIVPADADAAPKDIPQPSPCRMRCGVYFIRCGDLVKIGYAGRVEARVYSVRHGIPADTELLRVIETRTVAEAKALEGKLHDRFKSDRVRGEWFSLGAILASGCITCDGQQPAST